MRFVCKGKVCLRLQQPAARPAQARRHPVSANNKPGIKKEPDNKKNQPDNKRINNGVRYLIFLVKIHLLMFRKKNINLSVQKKIWSMV